MTSLDKQDNESEYKKMLYSTKTTILTTNIIFNLPLLFNSLKIVPFEVEQKRRGRKKKGYISTYKQNFEKLNPGDIIGVDYGPLKKGVSLKSKGSKSFPNSVSMVMIIEKEKKISIKISKNINNSKIHITGSKKDTHEELTIRLLFDHIFNIYKTDKTIFSFFNDTLKDKIIFSYRYVMKNKNFPLGIAISRERLDDFMKTQKNYISSYTAGLTHCVNIKIKNNDINSYEEVIYITTNDNYVNHKIEYKQISNDEYDTLKNNYKIDDKVKVNEKFHTFLVFCSGKVLQSGIGTHMEKVYDDFIKIINDNKNNFIDVDDK